MLRTRYHRTAFQEATSNEVRLSLDTDLCMMREQPTAVWSPHLPQPLPPEALTCFPYAVLEVKLQCEDPPPWVQVSLRV